MLIWVCVWRPEVNFKCSSSGAICIVLRDRIFHWVQGSLVRLGWQALYPLSHLPNSKSLSLILSDAKEIEEDTEDQISPLGF